MIRDVFAWMDALPSSIAIRESLNAFPILLTTHVLSMALFAGLVMMMDFRLAGIGNRSTSITDAQERLFPYQLIGGIVSFVTGALLFYSKPLTYFSNFHFWLKMLLLLLAFANVAYFHFKTYATVDEWNHEPTPPSPVRMAGYVSIGLWSLIIVIGRMAAYPGLVPQWWINFGLDG